MVPSGMDTPKLSAMVAPMTAKESASGRGPPSAILLDQARKGTYSRVWSVPV